MGNTVAVSACQSWWHKMTWEAMFGGSSVCQTLQAQVNQLPEPSHALYHVYDDDIIFRHIQICMCLQYLVYLRLVSTDILSSSFFLFKYIQSYAYVFHIYNIYIQYIHTQECFSDIYIYLFIYVCVWISYDIKGPFAVYSRLQPLQKKDRSRAMVKPTVRPEFSSPG